MTNWGTLSDHAIMCVDDAVIQALLHICSTWGISASECVMVGDSVKDDVSALCTVHCLRIEIQNPAKETDWKTDALYCTTSVCSEVVKHRIRNMPGWNTCSGFGPLLTLPT